MANTNYYHQRIKAKKKEERILIRITIQDIQRSGGVVIDSEEYNKNKEQVNSKALK